MRGRRAKEKEGEIEGGRRARMGAIARALPPPPLLTLLRLLLLLLLPRLLCWEIRRRW